MTSQEGRKDDQGKPDWSLVPLQPLLDSLYPRYEDYWEMTTDELVACISATLSNYQDEGYADSLPAVDALAATLELIYQVERMGEDHLPYPFAALEPVTKVMTFGAQKKYSPNNWRYVPDFHSRYFSAACRHFSAWIRGEEQDQESTFSHLWHMATCLAFLIAGPAQQEEVSDV